MRSSVAAVGYEWEAIVSSPLQRCSSFAQALSQQKNISLYIEPRFRETHFGTWEGLSAAELMQTDGADLQQLWSDPMSYTPPQAESLSIFATRVRAAWQQLLDENAGRRVLLITHGGVIRILLCDLLRQPLASMLQFDVAHASLHRARAEFVAGQRRVRLEDNV